MFVRESALQWLFSLDYYNLKVNASFVDRVEVEVPIRDFLSKPILVNVNSVYIALTFPEDRVATTASAAPAQKPASLLDEEGEDDSILSGMQ